MHRRNVALLEAFSPRCIRGFGALNPSPHRLVRAARPTGDRRTTAHRQQKLQQRGAPRTTEPSDTSGVAECSVTEPSAKLCSMQEATATGLSARAAWAMSFRVKGARSPQMQVHVAVQE